MCPPGLAAFEARDKIAIAPYSFENRDLTLDAASLKRLRANKSAWEFYRKQAPWYRRTTAFWIVSAKREETRTKRLASLIDYSARGARIPPLAGTKAK